MAEEFSGFERTPPQDMPAEQSVLGAMMLSKDAIADVIEALVGDDFYRSVHRTVFEGILDLYSRGEPADAVTVAAELSRLGSLSKIGGATYLHTLVSGVPTAANASYYARSVREKAILRRLVEAGTRVVQLGYAQEGGEVSELVNSAQAEIFSVTERKSSEDYLSLGELIEPVILELENLENNKQNSKAVPTGFIDLDLLTNGLHPGQMIIVAARPAMGKSTLALDFCRSAAIHNGKASVIFSLEMSRSEIIQRLISAEAEVLLSRMRSGKLEQRDWDKIAGTVSKISAAPLFIDDSPNLSMSEIRAKARRLKQQSDLSLIVVDYLQLMSSGRQVESRQQEVSQFSRALKLLAKEIEVPVVAVAQLNRGPESRNDKRPMLADLRESGSLEQDADVVMLLNRPDYYNEEDRKGEADIIVAKHRNGETRNIHTLFQGHYARFVNMAH